MKLNKNTLDPARMPLRLTVAQVAELAGENTQTVRRKAAYGTYPAIKNPGGRKWWFLRDQILPLLGLA